MGRYMKKSKIKTEEKSILQHVQSKGVRTRAKTLALRNLHSAASFNLPTDLDASSFCYLQLRSRRLDKPMQAENKKRRELEQRKPGIKRSCRRVIADPSSRGVVSSGNSVSDEEIEKMVDVNGCNESEDICVDVNELAVDSIEASFGENNLDFEVRDRSTRESTPCSFIRDSDVNNKTPGSTTRQRSSAATNGRDNSDTRIIIPTTLEIEEFFAKAEKQQHRLFMEKYNYDITNDLPLPGRYEWVQVLP